jgi:thioesterase domain-containing protein
MSDSFTAIFLAGAGGGSPDLSNFTIGRGHALSYQVMAYPRWQRYLEKAFSADALVEDLAHEIAAKVPQGPIRLIGLSIGGHLGYAVALQLQTLGREIGGFCAIDTFMSVSSEPSAGWKRRAALQALQLVRKRRARELVRFARSRVWRALLRLAGGRLPDLLGGPVGRLPAIALLDPLLEEELTMRLMARELAPWIAAIDRNPIPLIAPSILLRCQSTAPDDGAWRRRCPKIEIFEISGQHHNLFDAENIDSLREAFAAGTVNWD